MKLPTTGFSIQSDLKGRNLNIGRVLTTFPSWAVFVLVVIVSWLFFELGAWIRQLGYLGDTSESESTVNTAVGSILGLLGFILGFTFYLTWTRFGNRNGLVILQAKAIEKCYLYTSLLPEKHKQELRRLLHEYINVLLDLQRFGDVEKSLNKIDDLNISFWNKTASLAREDMDSELRSLFTSSVNELISILIERKTIALVYRIPNAIWNTLLLLSVLSMFAFGYQSGISRNLQVFLLPVALGAVFVLITDLDATMIQRRFKITQKPLMEVFNIMEKDIV